MQNAFLERPLKLKPFFKQAIFWFLNRYIIFSITNLTIEGLQGLYTCVRRIETQNDSRQFSLRTWDFFCQNDVTTPFTIRVYFDSTENLDCVAKECLLTESLAFTEFDGWNDIFRLEKNCMLRNSAVAQENRRLKQDLILQLYFLYYKLQAYLIGPYFIELFLTQ